MDPSKQMLDQILLVIGISSYITGTLVLIGYFLSRSPILRTIGIPLAIVGCASQFAELLARWNMTGVWPLTNLYGSLSLFSAMGVLIYVLFALRYDLWFIGFGVLGIAAITLGYATTWNEGYMPAVPALQSYWIKVHVPLVISSYASFMVAFVVSSIYLIKAAFEKRLGGGTTVRASAAGSGATIDVKLESAAYAAAPAVGAIKSDTPNIDAAAARGDFWGLWLAGLPSLGKLDIMTYRIIAVGLPLLTVGIITGAWWAKEAWGAYWQWDPKETAALGSWIVYAMYMHLHTRNAWRGSRVAWVNIIGFATIVFCYLGVNIFISGLHSYKM
ncbi:MAG: c-type cytochrome biogenesis protein CcsB [Candidatus Velthaea sp.]